MSSAADAPDAPDTLPEGLVIRPLTGADGEAFDVFRGAALARDPAAFSTSAEDWQAAPIKVRQALAADGNGAHGVLLGAFREQAGEMRLIGTLGAKRSPRVQVRHVATLWGLVVEPAARGKGVATALIRAVMAALAEMDGVDRVRAMVAAESDAARAVIAKAGFRDYGLEEGGRRVRDGDAWRDVDLVYVMRRL